MTLARALVTALCVAALSAAARAAELEYELRVPTAPVQLGEWFEIVVEGPLPVDVDLAPPADDAEASPDVIFGRPTSEARGAHRVLHLPVTVVREGEASITGVRLQGDSVTETLAPIAVQVDYARPAGFSPVVAEPAAPLPLPLPAAATWPFLALVITGLALAGAYVWAAGRVRVVRRVQKPAHLVALEALAGLRARLPDDPEAARAMVADVSAVLRRYIEARFALHAPARTTEEFLLEAAGRGGPLGAHREPLTDFLTTCDLATYAGVRPDRKGLIALLDAAEEFVETTCHDEPAAAASDAAAPDASTPPSAPPPESPSPADSRAEVVA